MFGAWRAIEIACGADGSVFALGSAPVGGGNQIFKFNGSDWTPMSGGAVRLSADGRGNAFGVANDNRIFAQTL